MARLYARGRQAPAGDGRDLRRRDAGRAPVHLRAAPRAVRGAGDAAQRRPVRGHRAATRRLLADGLQPHADEPACPRSAQPRLGSVEPRVPPPGHRLGGGRRVARDVRGRRRGDRCARGRSGRHGAPGPRTGGRRRPLRGRPARAVGRSAAGAARRRAGRAAAGRAGRRRRPGRHLRSARSARAARRGGRRAPPDGRLAAPGARALRARLAARAPAAGHPPVARARRGRHGRATGAVDRLRGGCPGRPRRRDAQRARGRGHFEHLAVAGGAWGDVTAWLERFR